MPYCPRCGAEVAPDSKFCLKCGASLLEIGRPHRAKYPEKHEKGEKREKKEKGEKSEKQEKREKEEMNTSVQLGVGVVVIFAGILFFIQSAGLLQLRTVWPYIVIIFGVAVILLGIIASRSASRRNPRP